MEWREDTGGKWRRRNDDERQKQNKGRGEKGTQIKRWLNLKQWNVPISHNPLQLSVHLQIIWARKTLLSSLQAIMFPVKCELETTAAQRSLLQANCQLKLNVELLSSEYNLVVFIPYTTSRGKPLIMNRSLQLAARQAIDCSLATAAATLRVFFNCPYKMEQFRKCSSWLRLFRKLRALTLMIVAQ